MPVVLDSPAYGQQVGTTYTGPEEDWLLANGYAHRAGYTGPGVSNTGPAGTTPENDPTLAVNREDAPERGITDDPDAKDYQFGTDEELAPRLESIEPAAGPAVGGTEVTIKGDNMVDVTAVTFDAAPGTSLEVVDDNTVKVTTPAGAAGTADVAVTDATGTSTLAAGYTYE